MGRFGSRGKHDRGYLETMHRRERRRNIIWGALLAVVIVAGVAVIAGSALEGGRDSGDSGRQESPTEIATSSSASETSADDAQADGKKAASKKQAGDKSAVSSSQKTAASSESSSAEESTREGTEEGTPLAGITICIDPGHCAHPDSTLSPNNPDSSVSKGIATEPGGTSGNVSGPEYKICMLVARQLKKDYEAAGAEVVMVRNADDVDPISPKNRALIANRAHADAFVRLHCDSAGSSTSGFYTLVPAETGYQADGGLYKKSQKMGRFMHKRIVKALGANDRGVTVRSDQGGFNWCKEPCVLFEMANMDNDSDDRKLAMKSYRKKLADAICDASIDWFQR